MPHSHKDVHAKRIPRAGLEPSLSSTIETLLQQEGFRALKAKERLEVEKTLRTTLAENEALLKEVHHRVKNNLQIVSSLLSLQAHMIDNEQLAAPLLDSQVRIQAMAMVHEKLYASRDLDRIDFPSYLRELSLFLFQAYSRPSLSVTPVIASDAFHLPMDAAIPCGLILSELISNCLKHAFADRAAGTVTVRAALEASTDSDAAVSLAVTDDGAGLPQGFDIATAWTLGLRLVTNLTRQLHGTLRVESAGNGTAFHVTFPVTPRSRTSHDRPFA